MIVMIMCLLKCYTRSVIILFLHSWIKWCGGRIYFIDSFSSLDAVNFVDHGWVNLLKKRQFLHKLGGAKVALTLPKKQEG